MKLRDWAKLNSLSYRRAWDLFKAGKIPNARKLASGSIVVDEKTINTDCCNCKESIKRVLNKLIKEIDNA